MSRESFVFEYVHPMSNEELLKEFVVLNAKILVHSHLRLYLKQEKYEIVNITMFIVDRSRGENPYYANEEIRFIDSEEAKSKVPNTVSVKPINEFFPFIRNVDRLNDFCKPNKHKELKIVVFFEREEKPNRKFYHYGKNGIFGFHLRMNNKGIKKFAYDKQEHVVIMKVIQLRNRGLSTSKITKLLNDEGIKTKRGKKWDSKTLYRLCKKYESIYILDSI